MTWNKAEAKLLQLNKLVMSQGHDSQGGGLTAVEAALVTARLVDRLIIKNPLLVEELTDEIDSLRFYRSK